MTRKRQDWTLARLFDGKWSVRFKGIELFLLHDQFTADAAHHIENLLNKLGLVPGVATMR